MGSLVGFGLAFLLVSWSISGLLGAAAVAWSRRRRDPAMGRALASVAVVTPPSVAFVVVGAILVDSALRTGQGDHCLPHAHHLHLCIAHGAAWAESAGAVALAAAAAALFVTRVARIAISQFQALRAMRALERVGRRTSSGVRIVPSNCVFLFSAGVRRPRVFVSSAAWDALAEDERAAALAHEHAHGAAHDVRTRALLSLAAVGCAPFVATSMLALWDRATERLRDEDAAAVTGPDAVAGALVRLARCGAEAPAWTAAALAPGAELVARVEALLDGDATNRRGGQRLLVASGTIVAGLSVVAIASADPLHHLLETLLGVF